MTINSKKKSLQDPEIERIRDKEIIELFADTINETPNDSEILHEDLKKYTEKAEFTEEIRFRIERQMNIHFQLLFQTLALVGEVAFLEEIQISLLKMLVLH